MAATNEYTEFLTTNQKCTNSILTKNLPRPRSRWLALREDLIKVNCDASVQEKNQKMGIGIVLRDSNGEVLACLSSSKPFYSHRLVAEL